MNGYNAIDRIEQIDALLEVKEMELALRTNRQKELKAKQTANTRAKQQFLTRIRLDIKSIIDEINALKTERWGLLEMLPSDSDYVW